MKTIKNRKSILVYSFALILALLLSSMIGTTIGKKPDNPVKSVETWDLQIWVGMKDSEGNPMEDIVLMEPDYLFAEDVPCSGVGGGLWDQPMKKGKNPNTNNYLAAAVSLYAPDGDDCGTYQLADVEGHNSDGQPASLGNFPLENDDIDYVSIRHNVWPVGEGEDYWTFVIRWILNPDPYAYVFYELSAWTDKDYELEGTLSEEEGWTIPFNEADAMLYSSWIDEAPNDGVPDNFDWMGILSFTVRITRTLHEA